VYRSKDDTPIFYRLYVNTGSSVSHKRVEPVAVSLAAFIRAALCSFLQYDSIPANSHFASEKMRRQKLVPIRKEQNFCIGEVKKRRYTAVFQVF
jgi:hypothetical protein